MLSCGVFVLGILPDVWVPTHWVKTCPAIFNLKNRPLCRFLICLPFYCLINYPTPRHFDLTWIQWETAVSTDTEFSQSWICYIIVLCGRPHWCHPVVFGFLHQSNMTLPSPSSAACASGCGLCIYTSDLWSGGYFCKHSSLVQLLLSILRHLSVWVCLLEMKVSVDDFAAS